MSKKSKNYIPNTERKVLEQKPVIELLLLVKKDLTKYFNTNLGIKEGDILSALEFRLDNEEKVGYLKNEINTVRGNVESDLMNGIYNIFKQKRSQIQKAANDYTKNKDAILNVMPKDENTVNMGPIISALCKGVADETLTEKEADAALSQLKHLGHFSKSLESITGAQKPVDALFYFLFYVHYEKEYLSFLIRTYTELKQPENKNSLTRLEEKESGKIKEKIEWLGNQKELGELFVELERKGWIKAMKANTIQACFTNTDAMKQITKPYFDTKENKALYSEIYTKTYRAKFDLIKPNTPKEK